MIRDAVYKLIAAVCHEGAGLQSGHYRAVVEVGGALVVYDDDRELRKKVDSVVSHLNRAYLLFYKKL